MRPPLLVLAGGFGTRLRSVVDSVPKALAPAGAAPFLSHLLESWVHQGVRHFVFMLHHQADIIEDYLRVERTTGILKNCDVRTVTERTPLGTGGAVANAVQELDLAGSFLVANADTWLGAGVAELSASPAPALAVVRVPDARRYGAVNVENGRVVSFVEKKDVAGPALINAGMYHLDAEGFRDWSGDGFSLETTRFPRWAEQGALRAVPIDGDFIDIGVPDDYFRFCRWAEGGRVGAL